MPSPTFHRGLSKPFLAALHNLVGSSTGHWWRDVLVHPDLKLAIRNEAIDVYHRGGAIFRIVPDHDGHVVARTHFKYLMRRRQAHAVLAADGKTFVYDPGETSWASYEAGKTLDEMVAASKRFAGAEKFELHPLIMYPSVIDVEIAFRSTNDDGVSAMLAGDDDGANDVDDAPGEGEAGAKTENFSLRHDRLDAATLEDRDGALWIVFHEAKHFKNPELRAGPAVPPPVGEQIARYRRSIETYASDITTSYREVCVALRELHTVRVTADPSGATPAAELNPLVQRAADGEPLQVDGEPRLIVFGFDDDQKNGPTWTHHRQRLSEAGLTVYAVGKPNRKSAAAAFARSTS